MNSVLKKSSVFLFVAALSGHALAGASIAFPDTPLTATSSFPSNVMLALSVEFPTMGSAYKGNRIAALLTSPVGATVVDSYYSSGTRYVGYWRSERCYSYNSSSGGYFEEASDSDATTFACGGSQWSGNFLNWAITSAIDVFRSTLSGGYRSVDDASTTILERAFLTSNVRSTGSGGNYPLKEIASTLGPGLVTPSTVTPYSDFRIRIAFGQTDFTVTRYDSTGTSRGSTTFLPRVKVCDQNSPANSSSSAADKVLRLASNCQKYGSSYKPVGEMQRNAGNMRFSVSSYLIDNVLTRDGGVIRSPMKSIGLTQTTAAGDLVANTSAEWDANGVFVQNPAAASEGRSGVLNYLNRFGLSANVYKTYDNLGELYSESLRYLMYNKQPAPGSISGITDPMKDGFPVLATWPTSENPIQGSCQANFIFVIGDTNTHCDGNIPGGAEIAGKTECGDPQRSTPADGAMNASLWANKIGVQEGRGASLSTVPTGSGGRSTYGWAGLAYWAHTDGIRGYDTGDPYSNVKVKTYAVDVDEPSGIALNQRAYWYAAKYGGFDDAIVAPAIAVNGKPDAGEWETQPGVPGTFPKTFFLASNGVALQQSIKTAFASIAAQAGGNVGLSGTSSRATGTEAGLFSVSTTPASWSGDLARYPFTFNTTTQNLQIATSPSWTASVILTGLGSVAGSPAPASRNIVTYFENAAYDFTWSAIPANLKAIFQQPLSGTPGVVTATEAQRRVDYVRGIRTAEADLVSPLRKRASLLGDPGGSSPVYVGPPAGALPDQDYATWAYTNRNRAGMAYLGTSEGMLHGFDAATGVEKFAYIPSNVVRRVAESVDPAYSRKPTLDAAPTIGDVKVGSSWKTILAGGLGAGGKGVYALDVSDPTNLTANNILWEFTEADDANVGQVVTPPTIARLKDGRSVVVFGSGYNSSIAARTGAATSIDGRGHLFVLLVSKGSTSWTRDTNYWRIALGTSGSIAAPAGVANPGITADGKGRLDRIYLGDLDGTMWKVEAPGVNAAGTLLAWPSAGTKLFQATASTDQPITASPRVAFHPEGGFLVLFGTGRFLDKPDRSSSLGTTNSFYGIWDKPLGSSNLTRSNLTVRTVTGSNTRTISGAAMDWSTNRGWYIDFGTTVGERVTYTAELDFRRIDFTTQRSISTCEAGSGFFMSLDSITGLAGSPSFDSNGDGSITALDTAVGYATAAPPGQASTVRVTRSSDPYAPVTYFTFVGGVASAVGDPQVTAASFKKRLAQTQFGRVNFRQITEIKR
jgi:type IV pilus assembly protein PilY1